MVSQYIFGVFLSKVDKKPEFNDKNRNQFYVRFYNSGIKLWQSSILFVNFKKNRAL